MGGPDMAPQPPNARSTHAQPLALRDTPTGSLELDELGEDDVGHRPDLVERRGGHGVVEVQDGDRATAPPLAAELHAGDVDTVPAAERPDAADDAGDIEAGEDEHPALRQRLQRKAVDPHKARLALEEDRPRHRRDPPAAHQLVRDEATRTLLPPPD